TITVYAWDPVLCTGNGQLPGACGATNLRKLVDLPNANCLNRSTNDEGCGLVNPSAITLPWAFTRKNPNAGEVSLAVNGEFYEAGINLSTLGLSGECFATTIAETRTSPSPTAILKDFVVGPFASCQPALTTAVQGLDSTRTVSPGAQVRDLATITVTGAASPDDAQGTVSFSLCGPDASANPPCSTGGTAAGT